MESFPNDENKGVVGSDLDKLDARKQNTFDDRLARARAKMIEEMEAKKAMGNKSEGLTQ